MKLRHVTLKFAMLVGTVLMFSPAANGQTDKAAEAVNEMIDHVSARPVSILPHLPVLDQWRSPPMKSSPSVAHQLSPQ